MLTKIRDLYCRIDARSLALFRWVMGISLLVDLFHRWSWLKAFYANDGVLPNHNHLFLTRDQGHIWSIYHSFSSVGENHFAFVFTALFLLLFTIGYKTRVFHVVALMCLVSLTARNTLLESSGNTVAIALMALSVWLPCGKRFSVDSLRASFAARDERTAEALNARSATPQAPATLAALLLLLGVGSMTLMAALSQNGSTWQDGSALYIALHADQWADAPGVALRGKTGLLTIWTRIFRYAEMAVLPLALIPVLRKTTRSLAIGALLLVALTVVVLFDYGLYGWSLLAACALLIPSELWGAPADGKRPVTMYYDDSCGICLWMARLLKRLDRRHNVTFRANSGDLPEGIEREVADRTMIVVDPHGNATLDEDAWAQLFLSLPLLTPVGWLLRLPGFRQVVRRSYQRFAARRHDVSNALGMGTCGVPTADDEQADGAQTDLSAGPTPAERTWRGLGFVVSSAGALAVSFMMAAHTVTLISAEQGLLEQGQLEQGQLEQGQLEQGQLGLVHKLGLAQGFWAGGAKWARLTEPWGLWAPDPTRTNSTLVVDAETRDGWKGDVLTGWPPDTNMETAARAQKGPLWAAYSQRIGNKEYKAFRKELRRYLTRGGRAVDTKVKGNYLMRVEALLVSRAISAPEEPASQQIDRQSLFQHRGRQPRRNSKLPQIRR